GNRQSAFTLHAVGFDEQNVAARRRPCQAHHHSGTLGSFGNFPFAADLDAAQKFLNDLRRHHQLFRLTFRNAAGLLAANGPDRAFEIANPGLPRIVPDDVADTLTGEIDLVLGDSVFVNLPRDQVLEPDMDLFLFRVTL